MYVYIHLYVQKNLHVYNYVIYLCMYIVIVLFCVVRYIDCGNPTMAEASLALATEVSVDMYTNTSVQINSRDDFSLFPYVSF